MFLGRVACSSEQVIRGRLGKVMLEKLDVILIWSESKENRMEQKVQLDPTNTRLDAFCASGSTRCRGGEGDKDEEGRDASYKELPAREERMAEMMAQTSLWESVNRVLWGRGRKQ